MKTIIGATLLALTVSLTPQTQLTPEIEQPLERISTKATVIEQGDFKPVALASAKVVRSEPEKPTQGTQTSNASGSCMDWIRQAGISNPAIAYKIFQKESGCRATASNPSSAAHGVCQSLPANKMATHGSDYMTNPVTQMKWCEDYAIQRYGSWTNAWAFWQANSWW